MKVNWREVRQLANTSLSSWLYPAPYLCPLLFSQVWARRLLPTPDSRLLTDSMQAPTCPMLPLHFYPLTLPLTPSLCPPPWRPNEGRSLMRPAVHDWHE